jgi:hypothetical protein
MSDGIANAAVGTASAGARGPVSAVAPCASAAGAAPAPAAKPCAGIGMDNPANEKEFAEGFKKLQKDWSGLTPAERESRLNDLTNAQLGKSGAPAVAVLAKPMREGLNGQLDFRTWTLDINDSMINANQLTDQQAGKLVNTVYHETRHAEQWNLMAQKMAGDGSDATAIQKRLGISKEVAENAVKHPLGPKDPRRACADCLFDSVYGKGRDHRGKTLTALPVKAKAVKDASDANAAAAKVYKEAADANLDAQKAYEKLPKDASAEDRKAAMEAWKKTYAQQQKAMEDWKSKYVTLQTATSDQKNNYDNYRKLPEEADAWNTGDSAEKTWKSTAQP